MRRRTVAALGKSSPGRCPCAAPSEGRPPRRKRPQARRRAARSPQVRKLHCADELAAAAKLVEEIASRAAGVGGDAVQLAPQLRRDGHRRRHGAHGAAREHNARLKRSLAEAELAAMCLIVPSSPILGPQDSETAGLIHREQTNASPLPGLGGPPKSEEPRASYRNDTSTDGEITSANQDRRAVSVGCASRCG